MNKRIGKLIVLGVMSLSLVSNHFLASAEITKPVPPDEITGEITNEKIKEYNSKVEIYNSQVDKYNTDVDAQYEKDLASVKEQNEAIDKHNAEEQTKVSQIEASNAQKQEEYNKLYKQYQKDLNIEKQLKENYGYESTAAYNEYANTHFNNIVDNALVKNADPSNVFDIDKSYTVTASEVSSGDATTFSTDEDETSPAKVKVHLEHQFKNTEQTYSKDFEILETDIITFYAAGAQLEPTMDDGTCAFYMYSPEELRQGTWYESGSVAYDTAVYKDSSGWKNGNIYVLSYKDGTHNPGDNTDIDMIFEYNWMPVEKWPLYNVPVEPKLELETYTPDIKEKIAEPEKPEHLEHLKTKDLINEPTPEPDKPTQDDPKTDSDKPKKKKKKPKNEDKTEKVQQQDNGDNNESKQRESNNAATQARDPKPAPASTSSIVVSQPSSARNASTGDYSILNFRIAILIVCAIVLFVTFYPWKKKDDQVEFNDKLEDIDIDDDDIDLS